MVGILEAAANDFEGGFLFDLKSLVLAELLGDFMEQANELFKQGYHAPAASLAEVVLEDSLKKLCLKSSITLPEKRILAVSLLENQN